MLITNLPVLTPAFLNSPWRILFGTVTKFERLSKKLLVPFLIGEGNFLYKLATGLNIALSNPWFKANDALLNAS